MGISVNSVVIAGNLTSKPDLRYSQTGTPYATFTVAVNRGFGDTKEVSFFDCKAFKAQAESAAQYLDKGSPALIEGTLKQERWEKDGQKRSKVVVNAHRIHFLGSKGDHQGGGEQAGGDHDAADF